MRPLIAVAVLCLSATVFAQPVAPPVPPTPRLPSISPIPTLPAAPLAPLPPIVFDATPGGVAVAAAETRRETRRAPTEEEALALAAMEGLMSQPAERALPLLRKVLNGSQTRLVKERALFVLSQIDRAEAHALLLEVARAADSPLRAEAIRMIGIGGNDKAVAALQDVYVSGDSQAKKQVLQAWMIAGRKAEVYQVAVNAKSENEAAAAIRTLSIMGAVDELRKLGELRKNSTSLLEAYAIAGDVASLRKIADGGGEMALRVDATRRIGIAGGEAARVALREIYSGGSAPLKDAALQGLLISNDQQGVLSLYRAAKSGDEKRNLLRTLSIMGGDAALAAIDAALEGKK